MTQDVNPSSTSFVVPTGDVDQMSDDQIKATDIFKHLNNNPIFRSSLGEGVLVAQTRDYIKEAQKKIAEE